MIPEITAELEVKTPLPESFDFIDEMIERIRFTVSAPFTVTKSMSKPDMIPANIHAKALEEIADLKRQLNCEIEEQNLLTETKHKVLKFTRQQRDSLRSQCDELGEASILLGATIQRIALLSRAEANDPSVIIQAVNDLVNERDKWKMKAGASAIENGQLRRDFKAITEHRDVLAKHLEDAREAMKGTHAKLVATEAKLKNAEELASAAQQRVEAAHKRFRSQMDSLPVVSGVDASALAAAEDELMAEIGTVITDGNAS